MLYLGRKLKLVGKNDADLIKVEQTLCEVFDLRNNAVKLFYSSPDDFEKGREGFLEKTVKTSYGKLNGWLEQQGTVYLAGDEPTAPDFHFFELIDQIESLAKKYNKDSPMKEFTAVTKLYESFKSIPAIQKYLESDLHKLPINNKMASFGAVPEDS